MANDVKQTTLYTPCLMPSQQFYFLKQNIFVDTQASKQNHYTLYSITNEDIYHNYYRGIGFLQTSTFVDNEFADTTETLLYVKNKFYNCGEMPKFFKDTFQNQTAHYINIIPNPARVGNDVMAYKTQTPELTNISFADELGRFYKTIQIPTCNKQNMTFVIPHQYLHSGINIIAFEFADGHKEVTKLVVN
jgi:hypothetical protein